METQQDETKVRDDACDLAYRVYMNKLESANMPHPYHTYRQSWGEALAWLESLQHAVSQAQAVAATDNFVGLVRSCFNQKYVPRGGNLEPRSYMLARRVRETLYPDRGPWAKLSEEDRREWVEMFKAYEVLRDEGDPYASALALIRAELSRALKKFPTWPTDPIHAMNVITEEAGELAQKVNELCYEPEKTTVAKAQQEAAQVASSAMRFLASMDRYEWKPSAQHHQSNDPFAEINFHGSPESISPAQSSGRLTDQKFLTWIHDRLEQVHGENRNVDYMHKLRSIIRAASANQMTPNTGGNLPELNEAKRGESEKTTASIDGVATVKCSDGDILVFRLTEKVTRKVIDDYCAALKRAFPNQRVVVLPSHLVMHVYSSLGVSSCSRFITLQQG